MQAKQKFRKRLMPYLPTWLDVLERHEEVQITPECRAQLLAMSAATADRLLRSQRMRGLRGISTTKAGCAGYLGHLYVSLSLQTSADPASRARSLRNALPSRLGDLHPG